MMREMARRKSPTGTKINIKRLSPTLPGFMIRTNTNRIPRKAQLPIMIENVLKISMDRCAINRDSSDSPICFNSDEPHL